MLRLGMGRVHDVQGWAAAAAIVTRGVQPLAVCANLERSCWRPSLNFTLTVLTQKFP